MRQRLPYSYGPEHHERMRSYSNKSQFTYKLDIQLVPSACRRLHITQPLREEPAVSPPCSDCCFTHCAVAGPLNSTGQQLAGWLMVSEVSGQAGARQPWHPSSSGLALPRPPEPPQTQGRHARMLGCSQWSAPDFFCFTQQQNNYNIHTRNPHNIQVRHDLATACIKWVSLFCYVLSRHLTTGVMYCKVIHCHAMETAIWHFTHLGRAISL